jgi:5-methylcytosine-specific restriction protein B
VDTHAQDMRDELFDDSRQDDLVQALLAPCPDIATTLPAVSSEVMTSAEEDDDQLDDAEDQGQ